jgi:phosphoadenosine phosphosulfate reductase
MYYKNLEINEGYKLGLQRVGCSVCPFSSNWSEFILSKKYKSLTNVYLNMIKESAKNLGIKSNNKIKEYIIQGQWKKRAGGEAYLNNNAREPYMLIKKSKDKINFVIRNKRENLYEWLKTIGEIYYKNQGDKILGEVRLKDTSIFFKDEYIFNNEVIEFETYGNSIIESKLKKILFKTTYCINCGACQIECPTNALTIIPRVKIDLQKCIHCSNCLNITQRGCLVAKSMQMSEGVGKMKTKKTSGFGRYLTFGMRGKWLEEYLKKPEKWFEENTLGNKQVESMKNWLLDSELMDKNKQPTELTNLLKNIYDKNKKFVWEIIWINLCFNSSLCNFYSENFEWNETYSVEELKEKTKELLKKDDLKVSERTVNSGIVSLINMFENSLLGKELKIGLIEKFNGKRYLRKLPYKEANPLSIGYLLYKISEKLGKKEFSISELILKDLNCNPYKIFGISKDDLEFYLRTLQEKYGLLNVELAADLDNVFLNKNIKPLDVIKSFWRDLDE